MADPNVPSNDARIVPAAGRSVNAELMDLVLQHRHYLEGVAAGTMASMQGLFSEALAEVQARMARASYAPGGLTDQQLRYLDRQLQSAVELAILDSQGELTNVLREVIGGENTAARAILREALPSPVNLGISMQGIPYEQVEAILNNPVGGEKFKDRIVTIRKESLQAVSNSLAKAVLMGEGMDKAAQRIRDTVTNVSYRNAVRLARTEIQRVANDTAKNAYQKHSEVLSSISWVSTLDPRTCLECGDLDMTTYWFDPPNTPSIDDAPRMPLHPNCLLNPQERVVVKGPEGAVPIEQIRPGDEVLTHMGRYRPVTDVLRGIAYKGDTAYIIEANFCDSSKSNVGSVIVTDQHPFYVKSRDGGDWLWVAAQDVRPADWVLAYRPHVQRFYIEEGYVPVSDLWVECKITHISQRRMKYELPTYNLTVEEDESYIAGCMAVHNCRCVWVPNTKSWAELGISPSDLKDMPGIAALDGALSDVLAYGDWFAMQDKDVQVAILGRSRWDDWNDGELELPSISAALPAHKVKPLAPNRLAGLLGLGKRR